MNYQIAQLQEEIVKPYRQLFRLYTPSMVASFTESLSKMSDIMTTTIRENITTGVYNNLNESLKQSLSLLELQKQFLNLPPELHFHSDLSNYSEDLGGLPEDDFVIVDDTTVKTYELPDSVYIPIGNNRIKMPTSFLLALIDLIILTISIAIAQSNSSRTEQINQMQIEESQLELQRAQNEMLQQLLHNIDTSSSSETETIKELKKTVEELNKQCSPTQDTCSPVEADNDNSESTEDTDIQE